MLVAWYACVRVVSNDALNTATTRDRVIAFDFVRAHHCVGRRDSLRFLLAIKEPSTSSSKIMYAGELDLLFNTS